MVLTIFILWGSGTFRFVPRTLNQRTNGPVNAQLRSVVYNNKHV